VTVTADLARTILELTEQRLQSERRKREILGRKERWLFGATAEAKMLFQNKGDLNCKGNRVA
jgi:hypothetical protein